MYQDLRSVEIRRKLEHTSRDRERSRVLQKAVELRNKCTSAARAIHGGSCIKLIAKSAIYVCFIGVWKVNIGFT